MRMGIDETGHECHLAQVDDGRVLGSLDGIDGEDAFTLDDDHSRLDELAPPRIENARRPERRYSGLGLGRTDQRNGPRGQ